MGYVSILDIYDVGKTLSRKGYLAVNKAQNKVTGANVAMKIVNKAKADPLEVSLLSLQAEILSICKHDNIVEMVDQLENTDTRLIVLDYMQGKDLKTYARKRGFRLSEQRIKDISYQILLGV